jgi:hypothetical protein
MATSKLIAALLGPPLVAVAASMLLNAGALPAMIEQAAHDPALIMVSGVITFVAGLAILHAHNVWTGGWVVVVTVLGWLFVAGGLVRILVPFWFAGVAAEIAHNSGFIFGEAVVLLALGGFLSFKGYVRS